MLAISKRNLVTASLLSLVVGVIPASMADTTVRDQATEGKISYHALVIGHGCEQLSTDELAPVIAQSVLVPTLKPILSKRDTGESLQWGDVIQDDAETGLAGRVELIQDRNIFRNQTINRDDKGNSIGFYSTGGFLQSGLLGTVPFRFSAVSFVGSSCAKRLFIELAVADICNMSFPPKPGTAELWLSSTTTRFRNPLLVGEPATLIVNRDLTANPLPANGCESGFDVTLQASREDVDTHLPFKGWGKK